MEGSLGVHLARSEERVDEIEALAVLLRGRAGVGPLLDDLHRQARRSPPWGRAVRYAFTWDAEDRATPRWFPQGITTSADAVDDERVHGRALVVAAWYHSDRHGNHQGSRLTFLDLETLRYRHVLLVQPSLRKGRLVLSPLKVHAGGIVWRDPYLHVAATHKGFVSCRVDDLMRIPDDRGGRDLQRMGVDGDEVASFGYRYVLPELGGFPLGELTALLQAELEFDGYEARRGLGSAIGVSLADRQASLLPEGSLVLGSVRPTVTWDARDDRVNATSGFASSIALDFSRSLSARTPDGGTFTVALVRVLATANVYVPLPRIAGRRTVLMLAGRFGSMLRDQDTFVVGTKRFFLGGVQTLRGFNEDGVYAQDVRTGLREAVARCAALISGVGCGPGIAEIRGGSLSPPEGGTLLATLRAELRLPVSGSVDLSAFVDAGNLWLDPGTADIADLRVGFGGGARVGTPIGPFAVEVGVNPFADAVVLEPLVRLHFSIGVF